MAAEPTTAPPTPNVAQLKSNKHVAEVFLKSLGQGKLETGLITDDMGYWSRKYGTNTKEVIAQRLAMWPDCFVNGVEMQIQSETAEDNRVSIEATGKSQLKNGTPYNDAYHFLFIFRDGKISQVHEYNDTQLGSETVTKTACVPPHKESSSAAK